VSRTAIGAAVAISRAISHDFSSTDPGSVAQFARPSSAASSPVMMRPVNSSSAAFADQAGKNVRRRHSRVEAESNEVRSVLGLAVGHANVAHDGQAEPTPDGVAVQGRDRRNFDVQNREEGRVHRKGALVGKHVALPFRTLRLALEVGTRAEALATSGDDDASQIHVFTHTRHRVPKTVEHVVRHAVPVFGPVQRDLCDVVLRLVQDRGLAHVVLLELAGQEVGRPFDGALVGRE
jgi:hypothetical protein